MSLTNLLSYFQFPIIFLFSTNVVYISQKNPPFSNSHQLEPNSPPQSKVSNAMHPKESSSISKSHFLSYQKNPIPSQIPKCHVSPLRDYSCRVLPISNSQCCVLKGDPTQSPNLLLSLSSPMRAYLPRTHLKPLNSTKQPPCTCHVR